MFELRIAAALALAAPLALAGCDDDDDDDDRVDAGPVDGGDAGTSDGGVDTATAAVFGALLRPMNPELSGPPRGAVTLVVERGRLLFSVQAGALDDVAHPVFLLAGAACPDPVSADTDLDGVLDAVESLPATGGILLAFDDALGVDPPPTTPSFFAGPAISERRSVAVSDLLAKLAVEDPDPDDLFGTLGVGGALALGRRAVMVHGVETSTLPATVDGILGLPPAATLPVLCGELEELTAPAGAPG